MYFKINFQILQSENLIKGQFILFNTLKNHGGGK